ncbi:MAG: T9SS type A sorting domain-containing protein [Bacteroidota bacterium]|nr:T9SS type A sorting domain-containing protein [Bacteroidota bacterium]
MKTTSTLTLLFVFIASGLFAMPTERIQGTKKDSFTENEYRSLITELISFQAEISTNMISIQWSCNYVTNDEYFILERTQNGYCFETLDTVEVGITSGTIVSCSVIDQKPILGDSYYRLRKMDSDGQFEVSNLLSVHYSPMQNFGMDIFPNPVVEKVYINTYGLVLREQFTVVSVFGMNGSLLKENQFETDQFEIDLTDLQAGSYIIQCRNGNESGTKRLVVSK